MNAPPDWETTGASSKTGAPSTGGFPSSSPSQTTFLSPLTPETIFAATRAEGSASEVEKRILLDRVRRRRSEPGHGVEAVARLEDALGRVHVADGGPFRPELDEAGADRDGLNRRVPVERGALEHLDAAKLDFAGEYRVDGRIPFAVVREGRAPDHLERGGELGRIRPGPEVGHERALADALQIVRETEAGHRGHVAERTDADVRDGGQVEDPVRGRQQVLVVVERHVRDARDGPRDVVARRVDGLRQVHRTGVDAVAVGRRRGETGASVPEGDGGAFHGKAARIENPSAQDVAGPLRMDVAEHGVDRVDNTLLYVGDCCSGLFCPVERFEQRAGYGERRLFLVSRQSFVA